MDDAGLKSVGSPKAASGKSGSNQGIKLAIAFILLVVAGLVVAYSQGVFSKEEKPAPPSAEEMKQYQQQQQDMQQKVKTGQVTTGGA
jgi:hypothetical protein